jgi:hypothetical protein
MKKLKVGRYFALALIPIGIILCLAFWFYNSESLPYGLLLSGSIFFWLGVAVLFFPGAEVDVPMERSGQPASNWYMKAPKRDKIVWIVALIWSVIFAFFVFILYAVYKSIAYFGTS